MPYEGSEKERLHRQEYGQRPAVKEHRNAKRRAFLQTEEGKEQRRAAVRRSYKRKRERLQALKSTMKCQQCGEDHPACLDFHHRDPSQKTEKITLMVGRLVSWERILAEIDKCDVLCANCHRKLHYTT